MNEMNEWTLAEGLRSNRSWWKKSQNIFMAIIWEVGDYTNYMFYLFMILFKMQFKLNGVAGNYV